MHYILDNGENDDTTLSPTCSDNILLFQFLHLLLLLPSIYKL
jgi:hypothetical protein